MSQDDYTRGVLEARRRYAQAYANVTRREVHEVDFTAERLEAELRCRWFEGRALSDGTAPAVGQRVVKVREVAERWGLSHAHDDLVHEITRLLERDCSVVECGPEQVGMAMLQLAPPGAEVTCRHCRRWHAQRARWRIDSEVFRRLQLDREHGVAPPTGPVYVASSWRNAHQPEVVGALRAAGVDCYDFRNPAEGEHGFSWQQVGASDYQHGDRWEPSEIGRVLDEPTALKGFDLDFGAMRDARACVLVMPCGRSAHIEAGFFVGAWRPLHVLLTGPAEPELMWRMAYESGGGIHASIDELVAALAEPSS